MRGSWCSQPAVQRVGMDFLSSLPSGGRTTRRQEQRPHECRSEGGYDVALARPDDRAAVAVGMCRRIIAVGDQFMTAAGQPQGN